MQGNNMDSSNFEEIMKDFLVICIYEVELTRFKENMDPTTEVSTEIRETIVKLIQKGNPQWKMAKGICSFKWTVSTILHNIQRNGMVKNGKHTI